MARGRLRKHERVSYHVRTRFVDVAERAPRRLVTSGAGWNHSETRSGIIREVNIGGRQVNEPIESTTADRFRNECISWKSNDVGRECSSTGQRWTHPTNRPSDLRSRARRHYTLLVLQKRTLQRWTESNKIILSLIKTKRRRFSSNSVQNAEHGMHGWSLPSDKKLQLVLRKVHRFKTSNYHYKCPWRLVHYSLSAYRFLLMRNNLSD